MGDAPDPDWYFEHVLQHASPGASTRVPPGPVARWTRSWQLQQDGLDSRVAVRARGFALSWAAARDAGCSDADIRRLVRRGTWSSPVRGALVAVTVPLPACDDRDSGLLAQRRRHAAAATAATVVRRARRQ